MKKSSALLIVASLILSACGSLSKYASTDNGQQYKDGIYSNTPAFRTRGEKEVSKSETQALIEQTKESPIYLFGDKKDTIMIPQDMSATIRYDQKLGGTVVTVGENPYDWRYDLENNYGYYYGPYSIGGSWYWSRHYSPWYSAGFAPWIYHRWYDPFYYGAGWYDPWYGPGWYYGGWYDPWYYGSYWYNPWYHPYYHHHHHHGWYDPYWNNPPHHEPGHNRNVYRGQRYETGSDRVFASGSSLRGGIGSRSTVSRNSTISRNETASAGGATRSDRVNTGRSSAVRTTPAARKDMVSPQRPSGSAVSGITSNRVESDTRRPVANISSPSSARPATPSNHRRPTTAINGTVNIGDSRPSGSGSYNRTTPAARQSYGNSQSSQNRSSSSYSRSSSSYERSSSSSSGRSSYSSGGSTRSSYSGGGGGGYSRSGGSSGGRR